MNRNAPIYHIAGSSTPTAFAPEPQQSGTADPARTVAQVLAQSQTCVTKALRTRRADVQLQRPGTWMGQQACFAPVAALPLASELLGDLLR